MTKTPGQNRVHQPKPDLDSIRIEKNVPIPSRTPSIWQPIVRRMEVGDSIVITPRSYGPISKAASMLGYRLTSRKEGDENIRVWRVDPSYRSTKKGGAIIDVEKVK